MLCLRRNKVQEQKIFLCKRRKFYVFYVYKEKFTFVFTSNIKLQTSNLPSYSKIYKTSATQM